MLPVGDAIAAANKIPVEKVAIRFEIKEVVNKPANLFNIVTGSGKTLNSAIINDNTSYFDLAIQELQASTNCSRSAKPSTQNTLYITRICNL